MVYRAAQANTFHDQVFAFIETEEKDHVFTITLNRPDKRNAFHDFMVNELAFALAYAHYQPSIWLVVLQGNGPVFCAGADLKAFAGQKPDPEGSTIPAPPGLIVLGDEFKGLHKPCIAKVHGGVYAGGFLMLGGCTHVIASDDTRFALTEVKRGIWPMQVMASLMPIMNTRKMLDMCMRGKVLSAAEAEALDIVTKAVAPEDLDSTVAALVDEIRAQSPTAIRYGLRALQELDSIPKQDQHKYLHGMLMELLQTGDAAEGLAAFREKRAPNWTGE